MHLYLARRLLQTIPTLLLVSLGVFMLIHLIPGDPVLAMLGEDARPDQVAEMRRDLGLDRSVPEQYLRWLSGAVQGNLGKSLVSRYSVVTTIGARLPVTLTLTIMATVISIAVAIPAGVLAAVRRKGLIDYAVLSGSLLGISLPGFFVGILLILLFSVRLRWFPAVGYTPFSEGVLAALKSLVLPAVSLGFVLTAIVARMTRASMLDILSQDFIRTAQGKGLPKSAVVYKHGLRNALVTVVTVVGLNFGQLLGGSVIIETVFGLPGMGGLVVSAINNRDYPVVQGVILFMGTMLLLSNLLVDLMYGLLDPRIRYV